METMSVEILSDGYLDNNNDSGHLFIMDVLFV